MKQSKFLTGFGDDSEIKAPKKKIIPYVKFILNNYREEMWARTYDTCHFAYWFLYSRIKGKKIIHSIGDSHACLFRKSRFFVIHRLGAATAYNLKNKKSKTNSNKRLLRIVRRADRKKDIFILTLGEIDCRIHIYNQYMKNKKKISVTKLISRTVENYGEVLDKLKQMKVNFCVRGIPPATKQKNHYNYKFYAGPEMHVKIYGEFNEMLKEYCKKRGYKYIDIYPKIADKNGFVSEKYGCDDGVHLNENAIPLFIDWLNKEYGLKIEP